MKSWKPGANGAANGRRVVWVGDRAAPRVGLGWETASITLHAISRDPAAYPRPCLYCQFDTDDLAEVRFVPTDDKQRRWTEGSWSEPLEEADGVCSPTVQEVFDAFSKSAEMNPDEEDEDEAGDGWIYDEEEVANGAREAQIAAHLDSVLHISPALQHSAAGPTESGQFDDADEDDELL